MQLSNMQLSDTVCANANPLQLYYSPTAKILVFKFMKVTCTVQFRFNDMFCIFPGEVAFVPILEKVIIG